MTRESECNFAIRCWESTMEDERWNLHFKFNFQWTFHLNSTDNCHYVRIWGTNQTNHIQEKLEHKDIPLRGTFSVLCLSTRFVFPSSYTVTWQTCLDMLQQWLFSILKADLDDFILQHDGAPPHWYWMVWKMCIRDRPTAKTHRDNKHRILSLIHI